MQKVDGNPGWPRNISSLQRGSRFLGLVCVFCLTLRLTRWFLSPVTFCFTVSEVFEVVSGSRVRVSFSAPRGTRNGASFLFISASRRPLRLFFYLIRIDTRRHEQTLKLQLFYSKIAYFTPILLHEIPVFAYICEIVGTTTWKKRTLYRRKSSRRGARASPLTSKSRKNPTGTLFS